MNANAAAAFLMEELNSFFSPYSRDATECSSLKSLLAFSLTQLSSLRIDTNFFSVPVIFERTSSFSDGKEFLVIVVNVLNCFAVAAVRAHHRFVLAVQR